MQARLWFILAKFSLETSPEYCYFTEYSSVRAKEQKLDFLFTPSGDVRLRANCSQIKYKDERI